MSKLKRFIVDMRVSGNGYIEILAPSERYAIERIKKGDGIQRCDEWDCEDYDLTSIRDDGEVTDAEIKEYEKESGEKVRE